MEIYVVQPGDALFGIARSFGLPLSQIILDNGLENPGQLVPGQALVVRFPRTVHTVRPGETLWGIALRYGISIRTLYRNNPVLGGENTIWPGETLVLSYQQSPGPPIFTNAYAYPTIPVDLLRSALPFLSFLTPFTYGFTPAGELVEPDDALMISSSYDLGTASLLHLSTLTPEGQFSNELAHALLNNEDIQSRLIRNLLAVIREKGYRGLDVDFEYVFPQDAGLYAAFLDRLTRQFNPLGYPVVAALAPKTAPDQRGSLYEGHDYAAIGRAVNYVFLMTYEWGYTYGPPMAVAPLPNVRQVVEYALTEIPSNKIWLGIPTYGYDWPLPFVAGQTRARSISNPQALSLARQHGVSIRYDDYAQSPWFRYTAGDGTEHQVWFEDARSIREKLSLISEYGLVGAGFWNLDRPFPQCWPVLSSLFSVRDLL